MPRRKARNGTLVLGGGFGGAHVARLLGSAGATIVDPGGAMLFTPLLPEVAAGAVEPRRVMVPLRTMCPHAELVRGRATGLNATARTVTVATEFGVVEIGYERLIVALGSTARMLPIPGLAEHAITFKDLDDAIGLRNHVLRRLERAEVDPMGAARHLCFVFVGAGYAGVEALAETRQLVQDAARHFPGLSGLPQRWVLIEAGSRILSEVPDTLADYTTAHLQREGVEILDSSTLAAVDDQSVTLADGRRIPTETVVWTAGATPNPVLRELGLPLDELGRIRVDPALRVLGHAGIWALGDNARVPNTATPQRPDPPTCQHAIRQARAVARSLDGDYAAYGYRSIGEGATLGRGRGITRVLGVHVHGRLGGLLTRGYHVAMVPTASRRWRIVADGLLSTLLRRDIVELGALEERRDRP
ncbi:NADH dehydrogenase [Knoellia sinensis KCTC 19936]|uniref:NADH dehydrogenase n=1 Tax=Knoellia sinensis KCTC 19936 TaxID=1385520 RepID=A0A0A0J434_9MICO|nr:FAD-dependent oxidoreductase [Knoellia sinensis]KGN31943.1 NADH dehydrogenase [Knoellia sinensis KCTC 19936]